MRPHLIVSLITTVIAALSLAACSSMRDLPPSKHVSQSGTLKVNPELLKPAGTSGTADAAAKDAAKP